MRLGSRTNRAAEILFLGFVVCVAGVEELQLRSRQTGLGTAQDLAQGFAWCQWTAGGTVVRPRVAARVSLALSVREKRFVAWRSENTFFLRFYPAHFVNGMLVNILSTGL